MAFVAGRRLELFCKQKSVIHDDRCWVPRSAFIGTLTSVLGELRALSSNSSGALVRQAVSQARPNLIATREFLFISTGMTLF